MLNKLKLTWVIISGFSCVEYEHYNAHSFVGIHTVFTVAPCVLILLMVGGAILICRLLVQLCATAVFVVIELRLNNHQDLYSVPSQSQALTEYVAGGFFFLSIFSAHAVFQEHHNM
jgi:hypothetical protein